MGPTSPIDIKPGSEISVVLDADVKDFETWSTYAEVGNSEYNHEGARFE